MISKFMKSISFPIGVILLINLPGCGPEAPADKPSTDKETFISDTSPNLQTGTATEVESDSPEQWENRYLMLLHDIRVGIQSREQADIMYKELRFSLKSKQKELLDLFSNEVEGRPVENLYAYIVALYKIRIQLLQELTPGFKTSITGFGIEGVRELRWELSLIKLAFQYKMNTYPRAGDRSLNEFKKAPLPAIMKVLELVLAVILFCWWRKWASSGLVRMHKRWLEVRPRQRHDRWIARIIWCFQHVRKPLEWIVFLHILYNILRVPEFRHDLSILWAFVMWILLAWFAVASINAFVEYRSREFDEEQKWKNSKLRLRSLRLAAFWILISGLGLGVTRNLAMKGILYSRVL